MCRLSSQFWQLLSVMAEDFYSSCPQVDDLMLAEGFK